MSQFSIAGSIAVLIALVVGCDLPGEPKPADRPVAPNEVKDFALLFRRNCSGCHGADGRLGPAPPLNDPLFLAIVPDEELLRTVREGRRGTSMPGFASAAGGPLTDEQVKIVAEGIKTHWRSSGIVAAGGAAIPPYRGAAGDAERGRTLFAEACAGCHGTRGEGGRHSGDIQNPAFLALISDQALRRIIITGRPDLQMPDFASRSGRRDDHQPLTSSQVDDLVALLARWRTTLGARPALARSSDSR